MTTDTDVTNAKRAAWAEAAIHLFTQLTGTDREDALGDLLCDLMHWAGQNDIDFDPALDRARSHYGEELAEERLLASMENATADLVATALDELLELLAGLEGVSDVLDGDVFPLRQDSCRLC